jgi:hypothetical protein
VGIDALNSIVPFNTISKGEPDKWRASRGASVSILARDYFDVI